MAEVDISSEVERLSEALVLAEPQDLPAMAEIHTMLQNITQWASEESQGKAATVATKAADLIESIILDEIEDPAAALGLVGQVAAALQAIVRDGRGPDEVDFPQQLTGDGAPEPPDGAALPEIAGHVDEKIFADFLARQQGVLDDMERLLLALEQEANENDLQELKRLIHTLKGESGMLGLTDVERLCHTIEDGLTEASVGAMSDTLLEAQDWLGRLFAAYRGEGDPPESVQGLLAKLTGEAPPAESAPQTPPSPAQEPEPAGEAPPGPPPEPKMLEGDPALLGEFVSEAKEHLDNADVHLLTLETEPQNEEALNAVFRAFHTIKGVSGFLALDDVQSLSHEAENLLDRARKGDLTLEGGYIDLTFDAVDFLKRLIDHVAASLESGEPLPYEVELPGLVKRLSSAAAGKIIEAAKVPVVEPEQRLGEVLVESGVASPAAVERAAYMQHLEPGPEKLGEMLLHDNLMSRAQLEEALAVQRQPGEKRKLGEILIDTGAVTADDLAALLDKQEHGPDRPKMGELLVKSGDASAKEVAQAVRGQTRQRAVEVKESVKVDAERLDRLIDLIGEMVIAESMVTQSGELNNNISSELGRQLSQLDKITRELQEMGTSLRMVPVRATFQKMARLARDVAKKAGKQIQFIMAGEDTELDKSVVDKIGDPLVHMVRNAVDHGIEASAEDRTAAGKPPEGRVELRAFHKGGSIFVEIQDDGRGLDRDVILAKGRERGLVKGGDIPSDSEIFKLIFEPGFSTAKQVTDVSGRGVGMDVVRRNIEALRGQIDIKSEPGSGSVFSIRLPLTLAIIDGMVIRVGEERYIIPTLSVVRSIQPAAEELFTVVGKGEMLSIQGELLPMFRLHGLFNVTDAQTDPTQGLVVIVEDGGRQAGLLVDELLGQQQIVIKSLGEALQGLSGVAGGAIMSDGLVGLILDVGGLVKLANTERTKEEA